MRYFFHRLRLRIVWSWAGCVATYRSEYSFRTWVWANLISGALAILLPLTGAERALILALGILVMAFELINTAVEHTVDYISKEQHPLAGAAKDAGSAAVAVCALAAGAAWVVILLRIYWVV